MPRYIETSAPFTLLHILGYHLVSVDYNLVDFPGNSQGKGPECHKIKRRAFLRELEATSRLRGPHIVHIYKAISSRKISLVLVMELMSGSELRVFLNPALNPNAEGENPLNRGRRLC